MMTQADLFLWEIVPRLLPGYSQSFHRVIGVALGFLNESCV